MLNLIQNLFWLNLKKLKKKVFWKILFSVIQLFLFASTLYTGTGTLWVPSETFGFIFILITLSNTLFLYIKISSDLGIISLYRSLGASKSFIVLDNLMEFLMLYAIALVLFALTLIFLKYNARLFSISLLQILIAASESMLFSFIAMNRAEKTEKAG